VLFAAKIAQLRYMFEINKDNNEGANMKRTVFFISLIIVIYFFAFTVSGEKMNPDTHVSSTSSALKGDIKAATVNINYSNVPLYFVANKGQVREIAEYYARTSRYTLWLTRQGLVFDSFKKENAGKSGKSGKTRTKPVFSRDVSRLKFLGAKKKPQLVPVEKSALKVNYIRGGDKTKWSSAPTSNAVLYKELYENIDLKVYGKEKSIEYDWIVGTGGKPSDIAFQYHHVKATRIDSDGNLLVTTGFGELVHRRPVGFQEIDGKKVPVNVTYRHIKENTYGFNVPAYNCNYPLVIDPVVLAWSTYLGGSGEDDARSIAVDGSGNVYVAGYTLSTDFPVSDEYMSDPGDGFIDTYVAKLDPTVGGPSQLLYCTYLGGNDDDECDGMVIDGSGIVYVAGSTLSTDFPVVNEYMSDPGDVDYDMWIAKLDTGQSGASGLLYSSYLGGNSMEVTYGLAYHSGRVYLAGSTASSDFPLKDEYNATLQSVDMTVTVMDLSQSGANSLVYSTLVGGTDIDLASDIAVDASGLVYVVGDSDSDDFPTVNEYMTDPFDAWVDCIMFKLDITQGASGLLYSTYLGGLDTDEARGIVVDNSGQVYLALLSDSPDFPTVNEYMTEPGDAYLSDMVISKLDTNKSGTSSLLYSTYMGGYGVDTAIDLALDANDFLYVVGSSESTDFPILNEYMGDPGDSEDDLIVMIMDLTRSGTDSLLFSSYIGGNLDEDAKSICLDSLGNIYVAGDSNSTDFPVAGEYMSEPGDANEDCVFFKLTLTGPTVTTGAVTDIGISTAVGSGEVVNAIFPVTDRGLCWSTSPAPTTSDSTVSNGAGAGTIAGSLTGLTPNTTYYVRSYAVDHLDTYYGNEVSFVSSTPGNPTVVTDAVYNITTTGAAGGGNVLDDGGDTVTERGLCWGTSPYPTTSGSSVSSGAGTGTFSGAMTALTANTTYYVRAYAVNSAGTGYGNQVSFTTAAEGSVVIPTVTTDAAYNITATGAVSGGNVISDGGDTVTERGLCYNTGGNPTTANSTLPVGSGTGSFSATLTGLASGITYYVRAYAVNSGGTGYGNQVSFTTTGGGGGTVVLPTVITGAVSGITATTAICGGNVTAEGSSSVIISGLVWNTTGSPTLSNSIAVLGAGSGSFSGTMTDLNPDTAYYVRAFATNAQGTAYGNEKNFYTTSTGNEEIHISRNLLNFASEFQSKSAVTGSQTVYVNTTGNGTSNWTATVSPGAGWLTCTPGTGTGAGAVTVSVDPTGVPTSSYGGTVTVSNGNSSKTISVYLTVYPKGKTEKPFGSFETPLNGSTVMSSVPVTGWVLDDIGIEGVVIYRTNVPGQENSGLVKIGEAVLVQGARPDIDEAYKSYPCSYRAGWGYMLLSNYLPNNGNGSYTLVVKAVDKEGNEVNLGSKTIDVDNAGATNPFGAIDTPAQGGTASGSNYVNYGWALTPRPNTIPIDGSTITVWVDGVPLGQPVYNQYREDIATLFPGYNNSSGAVGYFPFDTTGYDNGVHTISWSVADNAGNIDGIGSRFFIIDNRGGNKAASTVSSASTVNTLHTRSIPALARWQPVIDPSRIRRAAVSKTAVTLRKGYDPVSKGQTLQPATNGVIQIQTAETERIELHLGNEASRRIVAGYLMTGKRYTPLPIGSTLDTGSGIFYWQPAAGYYGKYRLVFVEKDQKGNITRKPVNLEITAKHRK
jgi:hypothetical protein